jgi:hypothetical protein
MSVAKIYDGGGTEWDYQWIMETIPGTTIIFPKLVRDDFSDFYLYMAYMDTTSGMDDAFIMRSTNRGYDWDTLLPIIDGAEKYQNLDIAVADSSLYTLWTFESGTGFQFLQEIHWRGRGNSFTSNNLIIHNTASYAEMEYPRIGATTTLPDSEQLVYAFYSQENSVSGDHDLLYLYSQNGAANWTSDPDTLAQGSSSPVLCDIRGYQAAPNQWMNITYCFTYSGPSFENFWCWSEKGSPTNWQGSASVGTGVNRSIPELIYSPGASATGAGVVYSDSLGNLWFDAPWLSAGIADNPNESKDNIISKVVNAGSPVEIGSTGANVYDETGRKIITLNTNLWDLRDEAGKEVKVGIYFIIDKNGDRIKLSIIK